MSNRRNIVAQRCRSAWRDLLGRPAKPDYGVLVVLPFLAAAGGAFLGQSLESGVRLLARSTVLTEPKIVPAERKETP
jgi:hypothetical protein